MALPIMTATITFNDGTLLKGEALVAPIGMMMDFGEIADDHIRDRVKSALEEVGARFIPNPDLGPNERITYTNGDFSLSMTGREVASMSDKKAEEAASDMAADLLSKFSTNGQTPQ